MVAAIGICLVFAGPVQAGKSGIWKAGDGNWTFYIQTYDTGSCVVIGTRDGEVLYVFLEPECSGDIDEEEYFGRSAEIQLSYDDDDSAVTDITVAEETNRYDIMMESFIGSE